MTAELPLEFTSWEQCRDYYALEALFLGQNYDRHPGPRNKRAYMAAARKAVEANAMCEQPLEVEEPTDDG